MSPSTIVRGGLLAGFLVALAARAPGSGAAAGGGRPAECPKRRRGDCARRRLGLPSRRPKVTCKGEKPMKRTGSAVWSGGLKDGKGSVSTESGILAAAPYSFAKRFGDEKGTNPEELIGAAHASCFSMALSGVLADAGLKADEIATSAAVMVEPADGGFAITAVHLTVRAKIPGASAAAFEEAAAKAKAGCPVSKVLNAAITMDAALA